MITMLVYKLYYKLVLYQYGLIYLCLQPQCEGGVPPPPNMLWPKNDAYTDLQPHVLLVCSIDSSIRWYHVYSEV